MAVRTIVVCDFIRLGTNTPCGKPAVTTASEHAPARSATPFAMALCRECAVELARWLVRMGFRSERASVDGKVRRAYQADSGMPFTTAEARAWLIEQGHDLPKGAGRVSERLLRLYAAAH